MKLLIKNVVVAGALIGSLVLVSGIYVAPADAAYEWVEPGYYEFGSCGGQGGDTVPGYLNQKYYSKYECRQALDPRKCYSQGLIYEKRFADDRVNSCGSWLQQQVSQCQSFVQREARICDQLAK